MTQSKKVLSTLLVATTIIAGVAPQVAPVGVVAAEQGVNAVAEITEVRVLNAMTLQIKFDGTLPAADVADANLDAIKGHFQFSNGLQIVNVPRLKSGSTDTYIVPVTVQTPGTAYTLRYKGGATQNFTGSGDKLTIRDTRQVEADTFELESFQADGVVDYANIIAAYAGGRGDQAFVVDDENRDANGTQFQVISSLRDRSVTVTGSNGDTYTANYVPFTQASDRRQAPKFRLPAGKTLVPGVTYTVSSNWTDIRNATFTARAMERLNIASAEFVDATSFKLTLDADPGMDLLAGRSVVLKGSDGSKLTANYRYSSRQGATGTFDVTGGTLNENISYEILPQNSWAKPTSVTLGDAKQAAYKIESLNAMTLQITFPEALPANEVADSNLETIKSNFVFSNGLSIVNVPRLKSGSKSTYIVPVTVQKPGQTYTLSYKGAAAETFVGSDKKINIRDSKQVTNDTFELESFQADGVVDYANIIAAYAGGRGDQAFIIDDENRDANGKQYQVISSLRDRSVTLTGGNGDVIKANYVPFTQASDRRQAPKFRLPVGEKLQPGVTYTVTSDWATVANASFTAKEIAPLVISKATPVDAKSFELTLGADPTMDLFAGRQVELQGSDGTKLTAQYRYSSRQGATGIFDLVSGDINADVVYTIVPLNAWATANKITLGEAKIAPSVTPQKPSVSDTNTNKAPVDKPSVSDKTSTDKPNASQSTNQNDLPKTGDKAPIIPMTAGLGAIIAGTYLLLKRKLFK
ncbi:LPXTG cell wall anchor domain-containing protein [Listeria booriae]|uniref:LPXTG cell wall anchor domain-containing protein n=1 Tax=Listeria booriae TaxID=1552123 RepID=A0A842FU48_9LIST|nr:LPXTG cell wall anchor domain-containing protein [Listeria booriae]MBC2285773.1 LPXTG cell wall anchor domain-containing protein [Listeria booriae]MBC2294897.1 LPXTG cell wall anchor domain-containing protein [Listeria booriae]